MSSWYASAYTYYPDAHMSNDDCGHDHHTQQAAALCGARWLHKATRISRGDDGARLPLVAHYGVYRRP